MEEKGSEERRREKGEMKTNTPIIFLFPLSLSFSQMHKIPNLAERLQSLLYKQVFDGKVEELKPDVRNVKLASHDLKNSAKILRLLEVVL